MKPLCVSFVEQDSNLAEQVLAHLHTAGIQCHHYIDAQDLAAQNAHQISDVVVLDALTLGEQSLTYAAKLAKHPEVRVVMIAPATEPQERIAAIAAGADVCISKPFNPSELIAIIERLAARLPRTLKTGWTIDPVRALLTERLQVCVSRLRKKLTHRNGPEELLATCWRSTYQFVPRMHFAPKR